MKFRNTLLLGLALILLCGGYVYTQKRNVDIKEEKQAAKRLFDFEPTAIKELRIQRLGEPVSYAEQREPGVWAFIEPDPSVRALQVLWNRVADRLSKLENQRTLNQDQKDLAIYGLEEPVLEFTFTLDKPRTLKFGKLEPTQVNRYALMDGMIFLVDEKTAFFELNRSLFELRHRYLVNDRNSPLRSLEFARIWTQGMADQAAEEGQDSGMEIGEESTPVTVERENGEAPWKMTSPVPAYGDQDAIKLLVDEIQFGFGENHIDHPADLRDYGLDPPAARITVVDSNSDTPQTIFLGDYNEDEHLGVYARREGESAVFTITPHLLTVLPITTSSLRDRHLFTQSVSELESLSIEYEDAKLVLSRDDGIWSLSSHDYTDIQELAISNYLALLKQIEMTGFTQDTTTELSLSTPEFTITGKAAGKDSPFTLKFWSIEDDDEYMYALQDTGDLGLLAKQQALALKATTNNFRSRELYSFNPNHVVNFRFTLDGTEYYTDNVHNLWLLREPEGYAFSNQSDPKSMLQILSTLKGMSILEDNTALQGLFGFDAPVLSVALILKDPANPDAEPENLGILTVGKADAEDPGYRFATISTREGVFRIPQDLLDIFRDGIRGLRKV